MRASQRKDVRAASAGIGSMTRLAVAAWGLIVAAGLRAADGPDPVFEKPQPVTMAELAKRATQGVSALEVSDYAPGHYTGTLTPSPPHADMNAKKAVVISWRDRPQRFVFCKHRARRVNPVY